MNFGQTKFYDQSGVIPFWKKNGQPRILLITSRSGKRWVIPKGLIEPQMSASESAEKEAFEEAGIKGTTYSRPIGRYSYRKWDGICRMTVLLMKVEELLETWPESPIRKRRWFRLDNFGKFLDERVPRRIISDLKLYIHELT